MNEITASDLPQEWKDFLKVLQEDLFPDAIIAGGALRDTWHDKPVSDVDIFTSENGILDKEYIESLFKNFGNDGVSIIVKETLDRDAILSGEVDRLGEMCTSYVENLEEGADSMDHEWAQSLIQSFHRAMIESWIGKVFEIIVRHKDDDTGEKSETKYQIITVNKDPLVYVAEEFDFGLCKIVYDGNSVFWDNAFIHDSENEVMTVTMSLTKSSLWRTVSHHYRKLACKYRGWNLVISEFRERDMGSFPPIDEERVERFKEKIETTSGNRFENYEETKSKRTTKKGKKVPVVAIDSAGDGY